MATQLSAVYEIFSRQSGCGARDTCDRGGAENGRSVLAWKTRKNSACSTGYVRDYCLFFFILVFQFLLNYENVPTERQCLNEISPCYFQHFQSSRCT